MPDPASPRPTIFAWERLRRPLQRVIVTHMHPNHVAGWLTRELGVGRWMSRRESVAVALLLRTLEREPPPGAIR